MSNQAPVLYRTQDVLASAYAVQRINGSYVKDTRRFSEDNPTIFSNKEMLKFQFRPEFRPTDFKPFTVTSEDYEAVNDAVKHFKRYTFGIIGDTLSDFQKDIIQSATNKEVEFNKLGLLAFVPELVSRETGENTLKKKIRTEYRDSEYIGGVGESVEGVCEIMSTYYSRHYERYSYTANVMGNLISFWNKFEIPIGEHKKFKAKVKAHEKNRLFQVNETKLNYVKLYKV